MEPIVGIDLGTTNSEIAFIIDENAQVIKENDDGIVPSCVGINPSGEIVVGTVAKNQAAISPDKTVLSVKRLMGSGEILKMGDTEYKPQEISAFILKNLKERAERVIKQKIGKAVITVPAYFTDAQRQATREAGEIAGLNVVRILNEPTAAALAYESISSETQKILVYDLGGGTFDVSIVKIENGIVEVLASTGDNHLGGDDFDKSIVDMLVEHIATKLKIHVEQDSTILARLKRAAEKAKMELSSAPYSIIEEDHIGKRHFKDVHLSYELSRVDFEEMIADDFSKTMESVNKALDDANMLPSGIDKIILVGGSTRIPRLSKMLEEKFGIFPHGEIDPDVCVVIGAAIQAGREMGFDSSSVLLDITPYTFGTSAIGELDGRECLTTFVPLIQRNTKLPASRSNAFYTSYPNQEMVKVTVYQGEAPNALDNILIGKYNFELTPGPMHSVVIISFELDLNGILKIEAIEKRTGKKINGVIENAFAEFTEQDLSDSKNKIEKLWADQDTSEFEKQPEIQLPDDINETVKRAEKLLKKASDEDHDEIVNLIEDIKDAAGSGKINDSKKAAEALEDILFYLEDE